VTGESADSRPDERSLPINLVRDGRTPPVAGRIASRNTGPSTSAQRTKAQIAEASGRRQHRSTAVCRALYFSPKVLRPENPQAGDGAALASRGLPGVLALEVTVVRQPPRLEEYDLERRSLRNKRSHGRLMRIENRQT